MQEQLPVIDDLPVDDIFHIEDQPFCFCGPGCPCREDQERIQTVNMWIQQGLMTQEEATEYIVDRTF